MNPILVQELNRDRLSKTAQINIGKKKIITPNFCVRLRGLDELNAYIDLRTKASLPFASSCVIKYYDVIKTIPPASSAAMTSYTRFGVETTNIAAQDFLAQVPIMIDPSPDSFYYEGEVESFGRTGLTLGGTLRAYIQDFTRRISDYRKTLITRKELDQWRERNHNRLWNKIYNSDTEKIKFIENMLSEQLKYRADLLIAPTPLIISNNMLEIAEHLNQKSKEVAKSMDQECAPSFNLQAQALGDRRLIDNIINFIANEDKGSAPTVFKFKNLDLTNPNKKAERETYRALNIELDDISRMKPNKAFIVLENGKQVFSSGIVGFHIVSSGFNGWDMSSGGKSSGPYNTYYHPEAMVNVSFRQNVLNYFESIGGLPDDCMVCKKYTQRPSNPETWNMDAKRHHLIKRNEENRMITEAILQGDIMHAIDKLGRSDISILRKTLPY